MTNNMEGSSLISAHIVRFLETSSLKKYSRNKGQTVYNHDCSRRNIRHLSKFSKNKVRHFMRIVFLQAILMKYHAFFAIFEKAAIFQLSSAANYRWRSLC